MPRFKMVVRSLCPEGIDEQAFNDWYQNIHLADIVSIPGFVAAERMKLSQHVSGEPVPSPYLAIYDIEAESGAEALKILTDSATSGKVRMLEGLDTSRFVASIYEVTGERVVEQN